MRLIGRMVKSFRSVFFHRDQKRLDACKYFLEKIMQHLHIDTVDYQNEHSLSIFSGSQNYLISLKPVFTRNFGDFNLSEV